MLLLSFAFIAFACTDNGDSTSAKEPAPLPDSLLKERWKLINTMKESIREGDLVLRCGNDFIICHQVKVHIKLQLINIMRMYDVS